MSPTGKASRTAQILRDRRETLGLTQEQLAVSAEVSGATVRNIEAGKVVRASTIRKLAAALDLPMGYVMSGDTPYEGPDRRQHTAPADGDAAVDVERLLALSPDELATVLLRLPDEKAARVLASYYERQADQKHAESAERRSR